jgi:uncharacterized membrane protein
MRMVIKWKSTGALMITLALVTFSLIPTVGIAAASDPIFTTIDVPDAISTVAQDINSEGHIVGVYTDSLNNMHGFLLANGNFNIIDFPGSTMTHAYGVNSRLDIVGEYRDVGKHWHGFLLHQGLFTSIDFPGATTTSAYGISPKGAITGHYVDSSGKTRAYLLSKHGEFSTLDPPFSFSEAWTHGVNSLGDVVGCWWDENDMMHSLLIRDGEYITNDFPDSKMSMNWRISPSGWVVGHYVDTGNKTHGYLAKGNRKYSTIDFPEAILTEAHGINDSRDIVGRYKDAGNKIHGFLLSGK